MKFFDLFKSLESKRRANFKRYSEEMIVPSISEIKKDTVLLQDDFNKKIAAIEGRRNEGLEKSVYLEERQKDFARQKELETKIKSLEEKMALFLKSYKENQDRNDQNEIIFLKEEILKEQNSNRILSEKVLQSEKEVFQLKNMIFGLNYELDELKKQILILSETKKSIEVYEEANVFSKTHESKQVNFPSKTINYIIFGKGEDITVLDNLLMQTKVLKEDILQNIVSSDEIDICIKLVNKCIDKLKVLKEKVAKGSYDSEKLANETAKIFKSTIIKIKSQKKVSELFDGFMEACNFRRLDWKIGRKLSEEDYEYLEEPILYDEVKDKDLDQTILDIIRDTYIIKFIEDESEYEVIIAGIYKIGNYKEG